ncbi:peptidoglycan editing factor PgeF [Phormidium sp. CLA17]|uniref:peptidoglycan editing factor PgeF n=1 Tax=Leptolyngbya sp. Cla-17 TaxID=2803751 RepID=UPI0014910FFD|nr:peptidoglycan editing factor PgeF [Leptolyngbya sp. Cla-17]MBM0740571.1 peptidoglycan editing factor PgeF [Leptolyngbya sp. Cla-17]
MHTWQWRTWNDSPYLTCSVLESWKHGFFTQQCHPRLPEELTQGLQPSAASYRVKQVHGNVVLIPSQIETGNQNNVNALEPPAADGLVTEQANQAVWVCSADCTPVLIADAVTGQVAAVHAGWRGTAQKIVPEAIARLQSQGSHLENLRIAMGPAISGEVYQVSEHVAAQVGATIAPLDLSNLPDAIADLRQMPHSPIFDDPEPGRARLDVRQVNALQLAQLGISPDQIAIAPHCTYQEPSHFFSYRRSREKKAQWSGIVSREVL